jgi:light-regulated signal transduction histidine kinase (bacteriophytochrome)
VFKRIEYLEALNQELEAFCSSVSHDLRTPLLVIEGLSRKLLEKYSNYLDSKGQHFLSIIRSTTQKMVKLIEDLLTFSHLERQQLKLSEINMTELAITVSEELILITPEQRAQFEIKTLPPVHGDQAMIRQVLVNLLSNALKFTKPEEAAVIEVGCIVKENRNIYYVKDNGIGFDMKYADKLFGAFQRFPTEGEFKGTGLGLAIVKRIINRHGGQVWAEGEVNEGSTFYFTLPPIKIL